MRHWTMYGAGPLFVNAWTAFTEPLDAAPLTPEERLSLGIPEGVTVHMRVQEGPDRSQPERWRRVEIAARKDGIFDAGPWESDGNPSDSYLGQAVRAYPKRGHGY